MLISGKDGCVDTGNVTSELRSLVVNTDWNVFYKTLAFLVGMVATPLVVCNELIPAWSFLWHLI